MGQITLEDLSIMVLHPNDNKGYIIYQGINELSFKRGNSSQKKYFRNTPEEAFDIILKEKEKLWGIIMGIDLETIQKPKDATDLMTKIEKTGMQIPIVGYTTIPFICPNQFRNKIQILPKNSTPSLELISNTLGYFTQYHNIIQTLNKINIDKKAA